MMQNLYKKFKITFSNYKGLGDVICNIRGDYAMKKFAIFISLSVLLLLIAGCSLTQSTPTEPPSIVAFTVNPTSINAGDKANLLWNVTGAASVSIFPGIGQVDLAGVMEVTPTSSTVYTLSATNDAGTVSQTASITVATASLPSINSFTAAPASLSAGQTATLQWNVTGATSVNIDQGIGKVDPSATATVNPAVTTIYTLSASNAAGNVSKSVTVNIAVSTLPSIESFSSDPDTVSVGGISTLQWEVTGATSVSITPGIGTVDAKGTRVVHPLVTTTYTLTANSAGGPITAQAIVQVSNALNSPPTISSFTSSSSSISTGGSTNLQWSVSNATTVSIDQNIGTVSASSGTQSVSPTATTTYTLTATNANGSKTATTTISVGTMTGSPPVITSFTATPSTIFAGQSSTLSYSVTGQVTTISIDQGVGTPRAFEQPMVFPTTTTTYTLTATNAFGSTTATATVTVQ